MSFAAESRERSRPVLPLAGMVDILFLLLIFFMTASAFRQQETQIGVQLPSAQTAQPAATPATQFVITITADNRIYLGPRELPLPTLRQTLKKMAGQFSDASVVIRGDEDSSYGLAVEVSGHGAGGRRTGMSMLRKSRSRVNSGKLCRLARA